MPGPERAGHRGQRTSRCGHGNQAAAAWGEVGPSNVGDHRSPEQAEVITEAMPIVDQATTQPPQPPAEANPSVGRRLKWNGPFLSKIALELFVVFVGVTAAFALDDYRSAREQNERREAVYGALDRELRQMAETRGPAFQREMSRQLAEWDQAIARGEKPLPPAFRLPGAERPPTGVWDAAVATGSIELVDPTLFYELARFYNRADSAGVLYQRYSAAAQTDVWPVLGEGPQAFWTSDGKLRPEIKAHVQRLRDFRERQAELGSEARQLRAKLKAAAED